MIIGLVLAVLTIIGTLLGVMLPLFFRLERKVDNLDHRLSSRIDRLENKLDQVELKLDNNLSRINSQFIDVYKHVPTEPALAIAGRR